MAKQLPGDTRPTPFTMVDPRVIDPTEELIQHSAMGSEDIDQVVQVLNAMRAWRTSEQATSEASRKYMKLGDTDMRALRYLIAAERNDQLCTPSALAKHLGISTASVTKMLDRLAEHQHIVRKPHPQDRRSTAVVVTPETSRAARESVGRTHAQRFEVAAALSPSEREVVIRFLNALAEPAQHLSPEPPE